MTEQTLSPQPSLLPRRNRRRWVAVCYDIPDDKRRTRVMKILAGYGRRVQYSVFECEIRPTDYRQLQQRLRQVVVAEQDDIRFYPLCDNCLKKVLALGRAETHRHQNQQIV
ncbi:MAG TPA: CRISPR-associated endonuclease Cas2 [Caldilineaceae bacterium]|nr:CRISPR-associated endonuclease Cas2 [Caldilineaceae bacterium]